MTMSDGLKKVKFKTKQNIAKLLVSEKLFNTEIKNRLDSIAEPFQTYLRRVKKWKAGICSFLRYLCLQRV